MGTVRSAALAFLVASLLIGLSTRAEDPLPLVQPKSAAPVTETPQASSGADVFAFPQVALAVYPLRDLAAIATVDTSDPSTLRTILRESIASNDQPRFDAALARAKSVAETLPAGEERNALHHAVSVYSDLQQVWSFAANDPYGAFYDDQSLPGVHARLAGNYSDYAAYISRYSLKDDRGRVLYPTAETRAFLLRQAGGVSQTALQRAPVVHPAKHASATKRRTATTHTTAPATTHAPANTSTQPVIQGATQATSHPAVVPHAPARHHKRLNKAESTPQPSLKATPAPVKVASSTPPPVKVAPLKPTPVKVAATQPAPAANAPAPVSAPLATSNTVAPPDAPATDVHRAANTTLPPAAPATPAEGNVASGTRQTQGLLFIIIALVAIGVMTIWARTPQAATPPPQIFKPAEPLATTESPAPKKPEAEVVQIKQNRAS